MSKHLAHYKTPGAKNGVRNYQSYQVAPTRSGMVGEERGEAAAQRARLSGLRKNIDNAKKRIATDREARRTPQSRYQELYRQRDKYSNQEFNDMLRRLDLESRAYQRAHPRSNFSRNAHDGLKLMAEMATAVISMATIYNIGATVYNRTSGDASGKPLPTVPLPKGGKGGK